MTRVTRAERLAGVSLVHVAIATGRTHQIRVHLAAIGHPVVGDALYGGDAPPSAAALAGRAAPGAPVPARAPPGLRPSAGRAAGGAGERAAGRSGGGARRGARGVGGAGGGRRGALTGRAARTGRYRAAPPERPPGPGPARAAAIRQAATSGNSDAAPRRAAWRCWRSMAVSRACSHAVQRAANGSARRRRSAIFRAALLAVAERPLLEAVQRVGDLLERLRLHLQHRELDVVLDLGLRDFRLVAYAMHRCGGALVADVAHLVVDLVDYLAPALLEKTAKLAEPGVAHPSLRSCSSHDQPLPPRSDAPPAAGELRLPRPVPTARTKRSAKLVP